MSSYNRNEAASKVVSLLNSMPTPATTPYGFENSVGISYHVKAGSEAASDFRDRIGTPHFYQVSLGTVGTVGQSVPLTTNRITLPNGFHRRVILRGTIPKLTTNCLFSAATALVRNYRLALGGQNQVYKLDSQALFHYIYQLEEEPRASEVAQGLLYTGVLSPYTFNPPGSTTTSGRPRTVNWLMRGRTIVHIPLPTPWYGPGITDKNKASDYWVVTDAIQTTLQISIDIEDYNISWRVDGTDSAGSDRSKLPPIVWDLLFEYIPRSEPESRLAKVAELANPLTAMTPTIYPYTISHTPTPIAAGVTADINVPLADIPGLNLWMTVRVFNTDTVDSLHNYVTDYVPINRAELIIPSSEAPTQVDTRTRIADSVIRVGDRTIPLAHENATLFVFNPALTPKAVAGYLDFQEKSPTLRLVVPNETSSLLNIRVEIMLGQLAFWGSDPLTSDQTGMTVEDIQRYDPIAIKKALYRHGEEFIH